MITCTTNVVSDLSAHLDKAAHLPQVPTSRKPSSNVSWSLPLAPTFRIPANIASTSALDRDLNTFARPLSQIDAMPPTATPPPAWIGAGEVSGGRSALSHQYELLSAPDDFESSAYWNPEQERLHALSSLSSNWGGGSHASSSSIRTSTFPPTSSYSSTFHFANSFKASTTSYSSTVPDEDEAAMISSTPSESPSDSNLNPTPSTSAHPLTLSPAPHAEWNFQKLFSRKRRWFGGYRNPSESFLIEASDQNEEASNGTDETMKPIGNTIPGRLSPFHDRRDRERVEERRAAGGGPSPGAKPVSRLPQELTKVVNGEGGKDEATQERRRIASETLRACAMERLRLVSDHLAWT